MKNDDLSYPMQHLLSNAPSKWKRLPIGVSCTNQTLNALKRRGLVVVKFKASKLEWVWKRNSDTVKN